MNLGWFRNEREVLLVVDPFNLLPTVLVRLSAREKHVRFWVSLSERESANL
jgi:hypothetical protein